MKVKFLWFVLPLTFFISLILGAMTAAVEQPAGGRLDPWFALKKSEGFQNSIGMGLTYGDIDRNCTCFPVTDEGDVDRNGSADRADCLNNAGGCPGVACQVAGSGAANRNYCTDDDVPGFAQIMFPGDNARAVDGEFYGMFNFMEDMIEKLFSDPASFPVLWPTLQGALCGFQTCMTESILDLCINLMDYWGRDSRTRCACMNENAGAYADGIMMWANRAFAKVWPVLNADGINTDLKVVVALYTVSSNAIPGDPGVPAFPASDYAGSYNSTTFGNVGSSEICVEADICGSCSGCAAIHADALVVDMTLTVRMYQNPFTGENSLLDVCVSQAHMDFKGARMRGRLGSYDADCDLEGGEDGPPSSDMLNIESLLPPAMVINMVNELLHGNCPKATHFCPDYQAGNYFTGAAGCQGGVDACWREPKLQASAKHYCAECSPCNRTQGGTKCNTVKWGQKRIKSTGIPPIDKWITDTSLQTGEGGCKLGFLPVDLNNVLNPYQPFMINFPGYDPLDYRYGIAQLGGATFDVGAYLNVKPFVPADKMMTVGVDIAIKPRWGDYWSCIDPLEMGTPQYTNPSWVAPRVWTSFPAPSDTNPYDMGASISQDFLTEILMGLYATNLFCWDLTKDTLPGMIPSALGSFDLSFLSELLHVPSFAMLAPGVEAVADPDGYASVHLVPAGSPAVRVGAGTYTYPVEYLEDIMPELSNPQPGGLRGDCYDDSGAGPGKFEKFVGMLGAYPNAVNIDNNWAAAAPTCYPNSPTSDLFSMLWTGYIMAPFADTYTFCTRTNDGVRLFVNNQNLINNWVRQATPGYGVQCGSIALAQGLHPIRMEYYEFTTTAEAHLDWCVPTANPYGIGICPVANASYVIPKTYLYSGGTAAGQSTGTYDMYAKLPSSRFEIWAPLNDNAPGKVTNEPVRLFSLEAYLNIGLDIEYIRGITKTLRYWGWDSVTSGSMKTGAFTDYFQIFAEIHPELVDIKYAADQRLTRSQMQDAIASIFSTVASGYIQAKLDIGLNPNALMVNLGMLLPAAGPDPYNNVGAIIGYIGPLGPDSPALRETQPPFWADNTAGDNLGIIMDIGANTKINADFMIPFMSMISLAPEVPAGLASLPRVEAGQAVGPLVVTTIRAPAGVFFEDEIDPLWTRGYALSPLESAAGGLGAKGAEIGFVGRDSRGTDIRGMRYSWRLDGGIWNIPKNTQKAKLPPLLEGKHIFEVMTITPDGWADTEPARLDFTVDTQAPRLRLQNVSRESFLTSENPTFVVEASDFQTQPEKIRIAYRLDGGAIVDNGFSKVINLRQVPALEHKLEVFAQDEAGNLGGLTQEFFTDTTRGGYGCGVLASGKTSKAGTIALVIILLSLPFMVILALKLHYREKKEKAAIK
jgi:hypothetical protein